MSRGESSIKAISSWGVAMKALFYTVLKKCGSDVLIVLSIFFLLVSLINKEFYGFIAAILGLLFGIFFVLLLKHERHLEKELFAQDVPKEGIYLVAHLDDAKAALSHEEMNDLLRLFHLVDKNKGKCVRVIKSF